VKQPQNTHFVQLRHTVPVEDTDGEFLRIALQVETTSGGVSDRQILRLRRREAVRRQGALRVLAVGISDYQNLPDLQFAAADARELALALEGQDGDGKLYQGTDIRILTDGEATLAGLRAALDQLVASALPGDTVVLALSGHGIRQGEATYFAPVRFDPQNAGGSGLPWSEVLAKLEGARPRARAIWVLADCCRSARGLRKELVARPRDLKQGVQEGGNLIVCAASSGDSPSYESAALKHGLFTQAWLEALRGEVSPQFEGIYQEVARGRVLTLSGLQLWLAARVPEHARQEGVRQQVDFPSVFVSFPPNTPVFVPLR
jgi:hypothetical protein